MNVELGQLPDGGLVVVADQRFPHDIRRIEYYRDQRLMMLVYDDPAHEGELMHQELKDHVAELVEASPSIMIVDKGPPPAHILHGYEVPLVQIGCL